jgi:hypothetical protein
VSLRLLLEVKDHALDCYGDYMASTSEPSSGRPINVPRTLSGAPGYITGDEIQKESCKHVTPPNTHL